MNHVPKRNSFSIHFRMLAGKKINHLGILLDISISKDTNFEDLDTFTMKVSLVKAGLNRLLTVYLRQVTWPLSESDLCS